MIHADTKPDQHTSRLSWKPSYLDTSVKEFKWDGNFGVVSITFIEQAFNDDSLLLQHPATTTPSKMKGHRHSTTQVSFVPKQQRLHGFNAYFHQARNWRGTQQFIPRLVLNNTIPSDSPVFAVVRSGRVEELQQMLARGQASLRDQDEHGASLLFVSRTLGYYIR